MFIIIACHDSHYFFILVTGTDYQNTNSTGSYSDEMSSLSLPYQKPITHWNPVIGPLTKSSISSQQNPNVTSTPSSSSSGCWDWLLYSPDYYSHLYTPSSSFVQPQQQDDETDLLARLPTWLLAILYPSMKQYHTRDDENDSDQEISSLNDNNTNNCDEALLSMNIDKKITKVSSNSPLSSENSQKVSQNRSSTPDTDDGYQSASDASRSDCSQQSSLQYDHHNSKDDITINTSSSLVPKRISYAAAVKPMPPSINNKISPSSTPIVKTKTNSSSLTINDMLNNNGQKLKFVAPRFERMHHAKQYSSTTISNKDSSSSTTSLTNRAQSRSTNNNNNNQRNHINNSTRRR